MQSAELPASLDLDCPRSRPDLLDVRSSSVDGRGVFTRQNIRNGDCIIEYTGEHVPWASVADEVDDPRTYFFGIKDGSIVINPARGGNEARWINHSCEPNCEAIEEEDGRIFIYALRDIRTGEEIFYDYQLEIDEPRTRAVENESRCNCGTAKCRGTLLAPV
ncbi:MAG: uncharacterized protein QOG48_245 [Verrucomicrobiota bacterium]|jgi:SET domain-containing protein